LFGFVRVSLVHLKDGVKEEREEKGLELEVLDLRDLIDKGNKLLIHLGHCQNILSSRSNGDKLIQNVRVGRLGIRLVTRMDRSIPIRKGLGILDAIAVAFNQSDQVVSDIASHAWSHCGSDRLASSAECRKSESCSVVQKEFD
jgi:hypothetical protein